MSRPYRLGRRQEIAQQTRERMLRAAASLLSEAGVRDVTIEAVAQQAGVSRVTVYDHFQSKAGLLKALAWWTFEQHDISRIRDARLQDDVRTALVDFVRENARFFHDVGKEGRATFNAARADPDVAAVMQATYFSARRTAIDELVARLADEDELNPSWQPARAGDALMIITSLEAFETLTEHAGHELDKAGDLLADLASILLRNR